MVSTSKVYHSAPKNQLTVRKERIKKREIQEELVVVDLSSVVVRVSTAHEEHGTSLVILSGHPESNLAFKLRTKSKKKAQTLGNKVLGDHVVEDRGNAISRDSLVSKTEDTVHWLLSEEGSLRSGLSEDLVLDSNGSNRNIVLIEDADHATSSVLDLDTLTITGKSGMITTLTKNVRDIGAGFLGITKRG